MTVSFSSHNTLTEVVLDKSIRSTSSSKFRYIKTFGVQ